MSSGDDISHSSIVTMTKLMNKKISQDSDSIPSTVSTRLTSSVKVDQDDLDREIAARMAAMSSGAYKPSSSYGISSSSSLYSPSTHYSKTSYSTSSPYQPDSSQSGSSSVKSLYEVRIHDLESELENEKSTRLKGEKLRIELQREVGLLKEKLEDAQDSLHKQADQNKKREMQLQNLSHALDESQSQGEAQLVSFKKKHQETVGEMMDKIDDLHRNKQKIEKEKLQLQIEFDASKKALEEAKVARQLAEKEHEISGNEVKDLREEVSKLQRGSSETQSQLTKSQIDASDAKRKLSDLENELTALNTSKESITKDNDDLKVRFREKEEDCIRLAEEKRILQKEVKALKEDREDDKERQGELQKRLNKAVAEVSTWQQKCQSNEATIKPEEVEELKTKFIQKIQEAEAKVDATIVKMVALDKAKGQADGINEVLKEEIEKLQNEIAGHEKRHKQYETVIEDWKKKVEGLQNELGNLNKEAKSKVDEVAKVTFQLDEAKELGDRLKRENANFAAEVGNLHEQLDHMTEKISELEKKLRTKEAEAMELKEIITDKDCAIVRESEKSTKAHEGVTAAHGELERRLASKDDEIDELRKSHNRVVANMQVALDTESKNKLEILRAKKELEQRISDLELTIDKMNKSKGDTDKIHRKYQQQLVDLQALFEDEELLRRKAEEELQSHIQKTDALKDEVDVLRLQLDSVDRNRRMLDSELKDAGSKVTELNSNFSNVTAQKKKLDSDLQHSRGEIEDYRLNMRRLDEALKKALKDSVQLGEDLKQEQARSGEFEKVKRALELQLKDLQARLDATEEMAVAGGKAAWARLERKAQELETDLTKERSRNVEHERVYRMQERKLDEMDVNSEEQQKAQLTIMENLDKMQFKIKSYKKHLDDAEKFSEINLAKYRKLQSDLEEAETKTSVAEKLVEQLRSRAVASVASPEEVSTFTIIGSTNVIKTIKTSGPE